MPIPATTLIKIETDATTLDQTKTLQAVSTIASNTGTVYTDSSMTPLVTTHLIYQHPTNLILSQTSTNETTCRSQATSPVACLTPPPDNVQIQEEETQVQDASNQTDTPICSEDDNTTHTVPEITEPKVVEEDAIPEYPQEPVPEPEIEQTGPKITEILEEPAIPETKEPEISEETVPANKPDLSGLELLSNSIVEFESCRSSTEDESLVLEPKENNIEIPKVVPELEPEVVKKPEESLGGLDLLCALAEQRIMEECTEKPKEVLDLDTQEKVKSDTVKIKEKERDRERRREKRKSKKHSSDEPRRKKMKSERRSDEDKERKKHKSKRLDVDKEKQKCDCQVKDFRSYKTPETEEEVKKFIASKTQTTCCKGEWPCINPNELDMRMKLAEIQRQYKEKQRELSKLKPKKHHECSKKKSRKKSTNSERSLTPPPLLDKIDTNVKPKNVPELLKPPTLCPVEGYIAEKRPHTPSDVDSSPEKSSSKKRKVGRPKRLMTSSGYQVTTETIVAKKPKTNFVGYLLAAKEKLQLQSKVYSESPPRYLDDIATTTPKIKKIKNINNNIETEKPKIRPKLKAEPTIKPYLDEENNDYEYEAEAEDEDDDEIVDHIEIDIDEAEHAEILEESLTQVTAASKVEESPEDPEEEIVEEVKPDDTRCTLTAELLEVDKLRVLTAMGGLFYAGCLNALEPPDVYSITLDGERGNRPHIMSREEILRDAVSNNVYFNGTCFYCKFSLQIVEVSPKSTEDLPVGTRLCAYWSQQYRCLYPGSVAEPGTPDPQLDGKFVSVEFDDGDSGKIALEDIRFLPADYPIIGITVTNL